MTMTDPIADMLTRIRNANQARHLETEMPYSRLKAEVARVLQDEGYIDKFRIFDEDGKGKMRVSLRYTKEGEPVLSGLDRVSRPGRRSYAGSREIPKVLDGLGICIVSTSQGVLSDREARRRNVGGEILCNIW